MTWWYITKKDLIVNKELRFPEDRFLEDGSFTFRLFLEAKRIIFLDKDVYRYLRVSTSIMVILHIC